MSKAEEQRDSLIIALQEVFSRNGSFFKAQMAFLYGSRAEGFPREDSDIDIGILYEDEITSEEEVFDLSTRISVSLSKEMKVEANVLPIYADFRKPMLYYNVIVKGIPVHIADYDRYLDLRTEAIFQMEDFEIFGKKWQLLVSRKNLEGLGYAGI